MTKARGDDGLRLIVLATLAGGAYLVWKNRNANAATVGASVRRAPMHQAVARMEAARAELHPTLAEQHATWRRLQAKHHPVSPLTELQRQVHAMEASRQALSPSEERLQLWRLHRKRNHIRPQGA